MRMWTTQGAGGHYCAWLSHGYAIAPAGRTLWPSGPITATGEDDNMTGETALGVASHDPLAMSWRLESFLELAAKNESTPSARRHVRRVLQEWGWTALASRYSSGMATHNRP
jgi:hypothetical protein